MTAIDITPQEARSGKITLQHLEAARKAILEDGYVFLNDLVDCDHMAVLRDRMLEDTRQILARTDVPYNFNRGNIQQDPPPFHPFLFRDVLLNDIVIAITKSILGEGLKNAFYSGNTALPKAGGRQPVHVDIGHLWPGMETATPPFALVVNIFPVDVSPQNGSTEIWPGSHLDTSVPIQKPDIKIPEDRLEARRKIAPPFQPTARAGSAVIRDIRMWHAGMPNLTDTPRPMIAMIHYISWWQELNPIPFPKGTEDFFQHPDLTTLARFVDSPVDYLHHNQAFDFVSK
jgi:ectoine hydroxylase-related dioxygenase (phytanoyl-CoA dioxygenase family)